MTLGAVETVHLKNGRRSCSFAGDAAPLILSLWLLWTNPAAPDLAAMRFYVTGQDSMRGAWIVDVPLFTVAAGDTVWRARPGMPDSLMWSSACRSAPTRYAVSCTALDTTGNESEPSNVVTFVVLP